MRHTDHIDGTDGSRLRRDGVEKGYHLLFVGDGDVETFQVGVFVENLGKYVNTCYLEVLILCVDPLVSELLVEVADGERVP